MQLRISFVQRIQHMHIVEDAGRGAVAHDCLDALSLDAVDDDLDGDLRCGCIDHIYLVTFPDRDSSGVAEPLRIIECSALGNCGTALLTGKSWMKRWTLEKPS